MHPEVLQELIKYIKTLEMLPGNAQSRAEYLKEKQTWSFHLAALLASILATPGLLLNTPAWALNRIITAKLKDKQMYNTFAYTTGLLFNMAFYPAIILLASNLFGLGLTKSLTLLLFTTTLGILSEKIRQHLRMYWCMIPHHYGKNRQFLAKCQQDYKDLNSKILQSL